MQQAFYTTVNNAGLHAGKKSCTYKSDPIPLLKENFLKEFRSEIEKLKARRNLGVPDSVNLRWENILGNVDEAPSLLAYIDKVWGYTTPLFSEVKTVKDALDKTLEFVTTFVSDSDKIEETKALIENIGKLIDIDYSNPDNVTSAWVNKVNEFIIQANQKLEDINNIIQISEDETNALTSKDDGLYVKDLEPDINKINSELSDLKKAGGIYDPSLEETLSSPYTVGGISEGTKVSDLKGKTVNELLDLMLFPTVLRQLVYPTLSFTNIGNSLVEVGSQAPKPELIFTQNDGGKSKVLDINSLIKVSPEVENTFDKLRTYTYSANVEYEAGEYLVDNKGLTTNSRVEEGSISTSASVETTYPWYIDDTKLQLVPYNSETLVTIKLIGNASIKLPGVNSQISSFKVDTGMGWSDVNVVLEWTQSTEDKNGITYKVWTKKSQYLGYTEHQLTFTLKA